MKTSVRQQKIEYGDFQTPPKLAQAVCQKLAALGVAPDVIIEPTCGVGAFVDAAANAFPQAAKIIGIELNDEYLAAAQRRTATLHCAHKIELAQGDFFQLHWEQFFEKTNQSVLVIGNFPWVTNSQQGSIGGKNLPTKRNFQHQRGVEALTGKSNFDISEWMLMQTAQYLRGCRATIAMLCKLSVARKFLHYLHANKIGVAASALYKIDAKEHFGAAVEACLLFCQLDETAHEYDYAVYESFASATGARVGHRNGMTVGDVERYERLSHLQGNGKGHWRSGIKHDCAEILELKKCGASYVNGLGETVELEGDYLYPLLKGSDIANDRSDATDRYLLVTQKLVGEPTTAIREYAPKTWAYLEAHADFFTNRKSRIYQGAPPFSVFGVGVYTFAPYKIAICGLYKRLDFRLVAPIAGKPVVFDDTVYFLSFDELSTAQETLAFLISDSAQAFLSSLIFWDEKRPIKASLLNRLRLPLNPATDAPSLF
jgi:hypothetical protein